MRQAFTKMHGLGNDFVVLDGRAKAIAPLDTNMVRTLADRREGIGCDQLVVLEAHDHATCRMRIYNRDGSEVEACGNAARAVGLLLGKPATIATSGGMIETSADGRGISVDMGEPRFGWEAIPLAYAMDAEAMPVGWECLQNPTAVNVGNPHAVFFVDDNDAVQLDRLGPIIEHDEIFPERVNVNVATIEDRNNIRLRVWERGAGLTRACGTGACATAIAAMMRGLVEREVTVHLPGGALDIAWGDDNRIVMAGPAAEAFQGTFSWADYQ